MDPNLSLPTERPPDRDDELFVRGREGVLPYPIRRRRAVTVVVTVAWMIALGALCAYLLGKW